jgi:hypothetical protein
VTAVSVGHERPSDGQPTVGQSPKVSKALGSMLRLSFAFFDVVACQMPGLSITDRAQLAGTIYSRAIRLHTGRTA